MKRKVNHIRSLKIKQERAKDSLLRGLCYFMFLAMQLQEKVKGKFV